MSSSMARPSQVKRVLPGSMPSVERKRANRGSRDERNSFDSDDSDSSSESSSDSDSDSYGMADGHTDPDDGDRPPQDRWPMPVGHLVAEPVTEVDAPASTGTQQLTAADQIVALSVDGLSRLQRAQLVADFNRVAELAAARAMAAERARLEANLTKMGLPDGVTANAVFAEIPPPTDLTSVLSQDVRALDKAFEDAGIVAPPFKEVTVEACGASVSFQCRDILQCMSILIGSHSCETGENFLLSGSGRHPLWIREQVDASNFRKAEASARSSHPGHHFAGICLWVDATPVTNSMGTSVYPVWGWIANVIGERRHKPGHSIVVAYLDTLKDVVIKRPGFSSVPAEAVSMVKASLWDEMMWVVKRPLMSLDDDDDRFGAKYAPRSGPGFAGRGGVLQAQRLPGKQARHAPFKLDLIQVVCDVSTCKVIVCLLVIV